MKRKIKNKVNINNEIYWNKRYSILTYKTVIGGNHRKLYELICDIIFGNRHDSIIDIGCGIGPIPYLLIKRKFNFNDRIYYGVDFSKIALNKIEKLNSSFKTYRSRVDVLINENDRMKYNSFDIVTCIEVLEHLSNYKIVILNCKKFLSEDGRLILSFPYMPIMLRSHVRCSIPISEVEACIMAVGLHPYQIHMIDRICVMVCKYLHISNFDDKIDKKKILNQ